jgi:signal transduction histidine kinase
MSRLTRITENTTGLHLGLSSLFKLFLLGGVALIAAVFIWYTFSVIEKLKQDTRSQVDKYVKMWQMAANSPTSGSELQFIFEEIIVKANFPIIVLDADGEPLHWRNIENIPPEDTTASSRQKLRQIAADMIAQNGQFPLVYSDRIVNYFCYGDSEAINQLKMMPFVELGLVLAFFMVAIIGFQNLRRSEERHIWVGMAKETAHQLGTPISSLMGWLEVLGTDYPRDYKTEDERVNIPDTVDNMKVDVARLQRVANRFGLIGSVPELTTHDLNDLMHETVEYFRRRLPFEGNGITIEFTAGSIPPVALNAELFTWALENLIKNALQAVDSRTGRLQISTEELNGTGFVRINVEDNGKGIPPGAARKIFRPGFTTKKRGWGLGLTLVKRIITEYHRGQIHLVKSKPGETLFEIILPVSPENRNAR